MHPILFKFGNFEIFTYGLMMAIGVLLGLLAVNEEAKRLKLDVDDMTKISVFTFLSGLAGSRILYVLTRIGEPHFDVIGVLFNLRAGFVYYGGLMASSLYLLWIIRRKKLPYWATMDAYAMGICIGLAIGRIGCFMGGCCYGSPTDLPWGAVMQNHAELGHLHPVQLYEMIFLVLQFIWFWHRRKSKAYDGEIVTQFVGGYAIVRFLLEYMRGDLIRGFLIQDYLSTSQFISFPMLAFAIYWHYKLYKKKPKKPKRA